MPVLSDQEIQILTALGTWISGIGAFAAAFIALWIALRARKVRLRCNVGLRTLVLPSGNRACLSFNVTNIGESPVIITSVGWRIGRFGNRKYSIQMLGKITPHGFPKKLEHGETASFMVDISSEWIRDFRKNVIRKDPISSLRAQIHPSVGHTKTVRPEKPLLTSLEGFEVEN